MLTAFGRAFRTPDLRRKLLFTLAIMAIFRLGSLVPTPGVSYTDVQACQPKAGQQTSGVLGLVNLFSGGALLQLSVFALGIMPYITASIIVQLLTVVIPRFETLKKEGQSGTAKLTQYTRYLTIGLAVLQSTTLVTLARNPAALFGDTACTSIMPDQSLPTILIMVITMTAGTGLIMWLGELITDRGIGNGMSLLIFTSIAARFPGSLWAIHTQSGLGHLHPGDRHGVRDHRAGRLRRAVPAPRPGAVRQADDRPPDVRRHDHLHPDQGQHGRRHPGHLRLVAAVPAALIAQFNQPANGGRPAAWVVWIDGHLVRGDHPFYMLIYFLLIIFFTYFYVSITFNPNEVADNMKKYGGFIPGIRAGRPTAEYLDYVLTRITVPGALYLALLSLIPLIALVAINADQNFPFGGTSILIIVGVGLETVKQIESQLQQRHYEGFLR